MDGIGLDNMLDAEQLEKMFGNQEASEEATQEAEVSSEQEHSDTQEETVEVDFSDLLGNSSPESVGSENTSEGEGGAPAPENQGTPQTNFFYSIAKAIKDEGVFPDLSEETLGKVNDAVSLRKMFDDELSKALDERQKRLEQALNSGASTEELQDYQQAMQVMQFLENKDTLTNLTKEGEDGERLRKQMMYQDYINRGFKHERAVKLIQKSIDDGNDIEDAKEAFESCKDFYRTKLTSYQEELENRRQQQQAYEQKQYSNLKKQILDTEDFYGGVKVDKNTRQKAYDAITKPVFKDADGNYMTALQKYQREHPMEFMVNMAMMMALTDDFKNVEKLTKTKVKENLKKGFAQLEGILNTTKRKDNGSLDLANTAPDDRDREKWQLAI